MDSSRQSKTTAYALWAGAGLLAAILLVLLMRTGEVPLGNTALAQSAPPLTGGSGGVFVMPAQLSATSWGCYLLDVDAQTLMVYQYQPQSTLLKLVAARTFRYDRKLANLNTSPSPQEIRDMLQDLRKAEGEAGNQTRPSEEP